MSPHPVQFQVEPSRMQRVHVFVRLALLVALATLGFSSGYWLLYLALPAVAALLIARDGKDRYLGEDASRILPVLRWVAGAYAYLWLLTDAPPTTEGGPVELRVELGGKATTNSALLRSLTSFPALFLLAVLSVAAVAFWVIGGIAILATERMPSAIADFISMKLRFQFRLAAYHLSLVDAYPALTDSSLGAATPSRGG